MNETDARSRLELAPHESKTPFMKTVAFFIAFLAVAVVGAVLWTSGPNIAAVTASSGLLIENLPAPAQVIEISSLDDTLFLSGIADDDRVVTVAVSQQAATQDVFSTRESGFVRCAAVPGSDQLVCVRSDGSVQLATMSDSMPMTTAVGFTADGARSADAALSPSGSAIALLGDYALKDGRDVRLIIADRRTFAVIDSRALDGSLHRLVQADERLFVVSARSSAHSNQFEVSPDGKLVPAAIPAPQSSEGSIIGSAKGEWVIFSGLVKSSTVQVGDRSIGLPFEMTISRARAIASDWLVYEHDAGVTALHLTSGKSVSYEITKSQDSRIRMAAINRGGAVAVLCGQILYVLTLTDDNAVLAEWR